MKIIFKFYLLFLLIVINKISVFAQNLEWRDVKKGNQIYTNGYSDQPYVVVLKSGKWFCVFTTGKGKEGNPGQHIVSIISENHGKTWSVPIRIEEPGNESAGWAMPYLTKYGRIYVFYSYNGDKIHTLNGKENIKEDLLGWYCYKFTDDEGKTWSKRYRLNVRKTEVDFNNDWKGAVQIMWGIGKPIDFANGMMFAFTKIGTYPNSNNEGWFFKCDNINFEKDPQKLKWMMLPDGEHGLKNVMLGDISEEQNIVELNSGALYCMQRTISGHPTESYSYDKGKSWSVPQIPRYETGIELKNPRACPRIWKCKNGKYLFWYHNHGGCNFSARNPAWISGGIEKDGKILWSQPEIILYEGYSTDMKMSYPDLIEQNGKYWISETNKEDARCHAIPESFLNKIWTQFDSKVITQENLLCEWKEDDLRYKKGIYLLTRLGHQAWEEENKIEPIRQLTIPQNIQNQFYEGFTIDFIIELADIVSDQCILSVKCENGKTIDLKTGDYGSVEINMNDGLQTSKWDSDPGLIKPYGANCIAVTVDNRSRIIQFVVNGIVSNGRDFRQYGWTHFKSNMMDIDFKNIQLGELAKSGDRPLSRLLNLRIYNRALMNSEIIGNHRNIFR